MQTSSTYLVICVALACEARPLIDFYQLKKDMNSSSFTLYCHCELPLALIVTGVGKIKMAAAIAYSHQYLRLNSHSRYINLGIAGSAELSLGDVLIAEKIIDHSSSRVYFPFIVDQPFDYLASVSTYDQAVSQYPEKGVVDMEAAAFFVSAGLFVIREQLLCVKVVSDTPLSTCHHLNKNRVIILISDKLTFIDERIQYALSQFSAEKSMLSDLHQSLEPFVKRWHFTVYQKNELKQLLRRWRVLIPDENPAAFCYHQTDSKQVLLLMMQRLAAVECQW